MTNTPDGPPDTKQRVRSPAYPFVSLPRAVEYARSLWALARHHEVRASAAIVHLGFTPRSGPGAQTLAALGHFGLVESAGANENRTVKLTDRAMRILGDNDPQSRTRRAAIREAAFMPKLYADLMNKFGEDSLPSDRTIRDYLLFERRFNEETVDEAIRAFRDTLSFAASTSSDNIQTPAASPADKAHDSGPEENDMEDLREQQPLNSKVPSSGPKREQQNAGGGFPEDVDWLSLEVPYRGTKLYIRVAVRGESLTRKHLQKAIKHLDLASEDMDDETTN